jgi:hypothetical protein
MHPEIDEAYSLDPEAAAAEFGAEFRNDAPVTEMGLLSGVGELQRGRVIDGILKVAARIWHRVAMSKCVERVYAGFSLDGKRAHRNLSANMLDMPRADKRRADNATHQTPVAHGQCPGENCRSRRAAPRQSAWRPPAVY